MGWFLTDTKPGVRSVAVSLALFFSASSLLAYPAARTMSRMVYDPTIGRVILFGGVSGADSSGVRYAFNDTWEWTGRRWVRRYPEHSPQKRAGMAMVFDETNKRIVLFGGIDLETFYNDTWEYRNGDWSQIPTTTAPSERRLSAATYDPKLKRIILFGGSNKTTNFFDTWTFDVVTNSWSRLEENGPRLISSVMAYDEERDQILLLGANSEGKSETYLLTGSTWAKQTTVDPQPPCPTQSAMVFQEHSRKILQFGGLCVADATRNPNVFEWDGSKWVKPDVRTAPGFLFGHAMAYDANLRETVMFGGTDLGDSSQTWRYRDTWKQAGLESFFQPAPRSSPVMDRDPNGDGVIMFGGRNEREVFVDVWRFKDGRWSEITPTVSPTQCTYPQGATDTDRKRLVMMCENMSVSEFDGEVWIKPTVEKIPENRRWSSMTYDPISKRTYMFGGWAGNYYYDVWKWDGSSWTEVKNDKKKSPPARMLATFIFDPNSNKMILFGGIGRPNEDDRIVRYGDMWSFDGTTWTELRPAALPSARYGANAHYDPVRDKILMFGGKDAEEKYLDEIWSWDGTTWTKLALPTPSGPRMNAAVAFDPLTQTMLFFGGWSGFYHSETWQLKDSAWALVKVRDGRNPAVRPRPVTVRPTKDPNGETQ